MVKKGSKTRRRKSIRNKRRFRVVKSRKFWGGKNVEGESDKWFEIESDDGWDRFSIVLTPEGRKHFAQGANSDECKNMRPENKLNFFLVPFTRKFHTEFPYLPENVNRKISSKLTETIQEEGRELGFLLP